MSSRMYAVWDVDGSLSGRGVPTILGSNNAWWDWDNSCAFDPVTILWSCPWKFDYWGIDAGDYTSFSTGLPAVIPSRTIVYVTPIVGTILSNGCDYAKFSTCNDQYAPYTVGRMSQWGNPTSTNEIDLSPWPGVSGIGNSGWYWRVKSTPYNVDGAPSAFNFGYFYQMAAGSFVVIAIAYPPATTFNVTIDYWGYYWLPPIEMANSLNDVLAPTENVLPPDKQDCSYVNWWEWYYMCADSGSSGFQWFFDGSHLYLRLVPYNCYNRNGYERYKCFGNYFESGGARVWNIQDGFRLSVTASCPGCTVQSVFDGVTYYAVADVPPAKTFESLAALVPSAKPTASPSSKSTKSTAKTTSLPSIAPSVRPSVKPSVIPSNALLPSIAPSLKNSVVPSGKPIVASTTLPSTKSSSAPIASTFKSTCIPTIFPSFVSSVKSSFRPSLKPSANPTASPSLTPTARSTSAWPTQKAPTPRPSPYAPTLKPSPFAPTTKPTYQPSTKKPSNCPSAAPSKLPVATPTSRPRK